jgi:hypothetical protein
MVKSEQREHLERLYRQREDPWHYTTSVYEIQKYVETLAILPRTRYRSALEIGCSEGVFTQLAAGRSDSLLAIDSAATALERGRLRCAGRPAFTFVNSISCAMISTHASI